MSWFKPDKLRDAAASLLEDEPGQAGREAPEVRIPAPTQDVQPSAPRVTGKTESSSGLSTIFRACVVISLFVGLQVVVVQVMKPMLESRDVLSSGVIEYNTSAPTEPAMKMEKNRAKCKLPKGHKVKVVTTKTSPEFKIAVFDNDADVVSSQIRDHGLWEKEISQRLQKRVSRNGKQQSQKLFVDAGANIGYHALYAASLGARVIAFEPVKRNAEMLQASACMNGFADRITVYNIALYPRPQECSLLDSINSGEANIDCAPEAVKALPNRVVRADRLDRYISGLRIDLMKIDVAGFEQAVMESGSAAWRDKATGVPEEIVFECHAQNAQKRGANTRFWLQFINEYGCSLDHSLENGDKSPLGFIPSFVSWLPGVSQSFLAYCGGANHAIQCPRSGSGASLFGGM